MSTGPSVTKTVWTGADFDAMDWHDNAIHAIAPQPAPGYPGRLLLDLDYIVEWVAPESPATTLSFWICPATLVFDPASNLTADIDLRGWGFRLSLDGITRSGPTSTATSTGPCPVTTSASPCGHAGSPSTCAARPSTATAGTSRPTSEAGSASTSTATPSDRARPAGHQRSR